MITENISTLKIHKLSQDQYKKAVESGNVEANALYLTPVEDDIKKHNSSTTAHEDIRKVVSDNTKRVNNLEKDLNIDKQKIEENKSQFDIKSVEGVNPVINNGANTSFYGMKLYGKTTQGENPSPSNPQPLESVGKWGNLAHFADTDAFTHAGVTWSCKNGAITAKGTANTSYPSTTGDGSRLICDITGKKGTFFASGSKDNVLITVVKTNASGTTYYTDKSFTLDGTETKVYIYCEVAKGNTVDTTIYPMLNEGTTALPYRPYSGQREVESGVYGKNLLENTANTTTVNGVTFTVNDDGSVTVNGTATSYNTRIYITKNLKLADGNYILSGCPTGGQYSTYSMVMNKNTEWFATDYGKGTEINVSNSNDCVFIISIEINNGVTINNLTFHPMIRKAEIADGTYVPYTKQSHISLVGDGLKGISVTDASLATYTDENGVMWCSDYVDCEKNVDVQKVETVTTNDTSKIYYNANLGTVSRMAYPLPKKGIDYTSALCSHLQFKVDYSGDYEHFYVSESNLLMFISNEHLETLDTNGAVKYLSENPITAQYILATPIETPLSASEIASYKALHSNYGITTVMNNCDAYMKIGYLDQKYDDGVINVVEKTVENAIGDIESVLDTVIALQEQYIGGAS